MSPRFGPIFVNNASNCGLLPVPVSHEVGEQLLRAIEADPTLEITIDVQRKTLEAPAIGLTVEFDLEDSVQHRLLNGLDGHSASRSIRAAEISEFEATRPSWMPTTA